MLVKPEAFHRMGPIYIQDKTYNKQQTSKLKLNSVLCTFVLLNISDNSMIYSQIISIETNLDLSHCFLLTALRYHTV